MPPIQKNILRHVGSPNTTNLALSEKTLPPRFADRTPHESFNLTKRIIEELNIRDDPKSIAKELAIPADIVYRIRRMLYSKRKKENRRR